VHHHALSVDVTGDELVHLGHPQAGGIDGDEGRSHFEIALSLKQPQNLIVAEDGRQVSSWRANGMCSAISLHPSVVP